MVSVSDTGGNLPPDDPESWTDEQWIEWLEQVDAEAGPEEPGNPARHTRSLGVQLMGAAMLGLHKAIYGDTEDEIVMVVEADGEGIDPEELEVHIDPDDPDASTVIFRPWLHEDDGD